MRFVIFTHSLVSDWNHGNAHFLRGIAAELLGRGHHVDLLEPKDGWSRENLLRDQGTAAIDDFHAAFPQLRSKLYNLQTLNLERTLRGADVVLVHEWNPAELVARIGQHRSGHEYQLLFHDTHHRSLTDRASMAAYDLSHYDGVLAYGGVIRDTYLARGWTGRAWTWHEAADTRVFWPHTDVAKEGDVVWIGNWGDDERANELREFLIRPVRELGLRARVYGVRYPDDALQELTGAGIEYCGWLANHKVPEVFGRYRLTVHVPRRPYVESLPGIPTIRPFEALGCGIPLISAPWNDSECLFRRGKDFLTARDGDEMKQHMQTILSEPATAAQLSQSGLETIRQRHTCAHRVDELLSLLAASTGNLTLQEASR